MSDESSQESDEIPTWVYLLGAVIVILVLAVYFGIFYPMQATGDNALQFIIDGINKLMGR